MRDKFNTKQKIIIRNKKHTQSAPDENGLDFVFIFSPSLDCTIIWRLLKMKNFVNFSKSFLSWLFNRPAAILFVYILRYKCSYDNVSTNIWVIKTCYM